MDTTSHQELSGGEIQYAIQHVFLPPNLPQSGDDPQAVAHETVLLAIVSDALQGFSSFVNPGVKDAIDAAHCAIRRLCDLRDDCGFTNERMLRDAFFDLAQNGM
jgi:hypothetical protein